MTFETRVTAGRDAFVTGSVRGERAGKGRFDLIPHGPLLRLAQLYERGAEAYGDRNWELGQPLSRIVDSMRRHASQTGDGQVDEDHAAAVAWNAFAFMFVADGIIAGALPAVLDDLPGRPFAAQAVTSALVGDPSEVCSLSAPTASPAVGDAG